MQGADTGATAAAAVAWTRQSAMMERGDFPFLVSPPVVSSHRPLSAPLRFAPDVRRDPPGSDAFAASASPPRFVSVHLIRWRSEAEIDSTEGK